MEIKSVRGVRDLLPEDVEKLREIEKICRCVVKNYGFKEVIIPTIENNVLYQHSVGETSDIVTKQMFEVVNRDEKDEKKLVLRPEGTAGVVRAFVEHNFKDKYPIKRFFYFGSMFRYERPQKGRFREFYQFGIEIFNEPSISSDLLLVNIINEIFQSLNIEVELEINNIGCQECRKSFVNILKEKIKDLNLQLCDLCQERLKKNPLRIFDCKTDIPKLKERFTEGLNIQKCLCDKCMKNFKQILDALDKQRITYIVNSLLVRGLDYYNGFVFEYKTKFLDAAQNTLCAGGRYDGLMKKFLSEDIPACGAAFGIDRIMEVFKVKPKENLKVGIAIVDETFLLRGFEVLKILYSQNKNIIFLGPFGNKSLKSQMRLFNNENCKYVLVIGEEMKENNVVVKNFVDNTQQVVSLDKLQEYIS